ncbi:MAG: hypothetical protein HY822_23415 [Acidobacteria bacterium]|nr:hypothetical protein [Acidobacteriota bacterium]
MASEALVRDAFNELRAAVASGDYQRAMDLLPGLQRTLRAAADNPALVGEALGLLQWALRITAAARAHDARALAALPVRPLYPNRPEERRRRLETEG